jgi:hypothetical protein
MARLGSARVGALVVTTFVLLASLSSCTTTARISDVYMALDGQGDRKRNVFVTDSKEVHCIIEMGIGRPGVTVEAVLRQIQRYDFGMDKFLDTNRVFASAENSPQAGSGVQKLDVTLKVLDASGQPEDGAPFPTGRFICEASLDGVLEMSAIFNIDFPDCPTSTIVPGTVCFGFYKNLSVCPHYGVSTGGLPNSPNCQCDVIKGWQCDPDP